MTALPQLTTIWFTDCLFREGFILYHISLHISPTKSYVFLSPGMMILETTKL